jgi:hypothetical protein
MLSVVAPLTGIFTNNDIVNSDHANDLLNIVIGIASYIRTFLKNFMFQNDATPIYCHKHFC